MYLSPALLHTHSGLVSYQWDLFLRERGHSVKQEGREQPALKRGPGGGRRNELLYISAATKERAERGEAAQ